MCRTWSHKINGEVVLRDERDVLRAGRPLDISCRGVPALGRPLLIVCSRGTRREVKGRQRRKNERGGEGERERQEEKRVKNSEY